MICLLQVINAARTLAARPRSRAARENMDVFKTSWETQVHLLVDAVDEITGIDEFLIVSGKSKRVTRNNFQICNGYYTNKISRDFIYMQSESLRLGILMKPLLSPFSTSTVS